MWDYGYRSKCCYAPIKMGKKKVKNTSVTLNVWICCKCNKRDVDLVEYTKGGVSQSTEKKDIQSKFASEE